MCTGAATVLPASIHERASPRSSPLPRRRPPLPATVDASARNPRSAARSASEDVEPAVVTPSGPPAGVAPVGRTRPSVRHGCDPHPLLRPWERRSVRRRSGCVDALCARIRPRRRPRSPRRRCGCAPRRHSATGPHRDGSCRSALPGRSPPAATHGSSRDLRPCGRRRERRDVRALRRGGRWVSRAGSPAPPPAPPPGCRRRPRRAGTRRPPARRRPRRGSVRGRAPSDLCRRAGVPARWPPHRDRRQGRRPGACPPPGVPGSPRSGLPGAGRRTPMPATGITTGAPPLGTCTYSAATPTRPIADAVVVTVPRRVLRAVRGLADLLVSGQEPVRCGRDRARPA